MSDPDIVTIDDVRLAGHCARGAKVWFQQYGLDFRAFLRNGIDTETMLATGDGNAQQVVARKRARERRGG